MDSIYWQQIALRPYQYCWRVSRPRLLLRPRPYDDEALWGYLIRLSFVNGMAGQRELRRVVLTARRDDCVLALRDMARLWRIDSERLVGPCPNAWRVFALPTQLVAQDLNHSRMRWCPACLKDAPYLRSAWMVKLVCACTKHGVLLRDICTACGSPQRLERNDVMRCSCGAKLQDAPTELASEDCLALTRTLLTVISGGSSNTWPLDARAWLRLIRYLGQFAGSAPPTRPGQISNLETFTVAYEIVQGAASLLGSWPSNFEDLLLRIQRQQTATSSMRRTFGCLHRVLYNELREEEYQFLRDAFESHLHERWWGLICRRHRSLQVGTIDQHPRVTVKEAAKRTGVAPALVRQLLQGELIRGDSMTSPSGRVSRSIHRTQFEEIRNFADDRITLKEAAQRLAIPKHRVRELINADILKPLMSRADIGAAQWMLLRPQVERLAELTGVQAPNATDVSVRQILKNWKLHPTEFAAITRAILAGELRLINATATMCFGDKRLCRATVRLWLDRHRLVTDENLSIDQAARVMGLKQQVVYELVSAGLIAATVVEGRRRRVTHQAIKAFQNTYVSLVELSEILQQSPKKVLGRIGAEPVSGPATNGRRQYFFLRTDVRLLSEQRKVMSID